MRNALGVVVLLLLVVVAVGGSAAFDLGSPVVWVAALALAGGGALALSGWLFARVPAHMRGLVGDRRRALDDLLRAEEAERERIAMELHDDTIQVMTAALITLDRVTPAISAGDSERAIETLNLVRRTLVTAVERTRRMTFELRPPLLEAHGLQAAVRDLADEAAREGGFEVDLHATVDRYPFAIEDLVYRTVQEALSNVRKHARASKVAIALQERQGSLTGWVRDDGRGFDLERALDRRRMRMHVGLDAMRERVHLAGGRLDIRSEKAAGTSVEFAIPLPAPRSSRG